MTTRSIQTQQSSDVTSQPVEVVELNTDASQYARMGWLIVIFGVLGFLIWASFAPLDRGVPMSGTVVVSGNRKAVQHLTGGTVDTVLVKDGDAVKQGQVLVRMNDTQVKAQAEISRIQFNVARATQARLIAEKDGKSTIQFPADLKVMMSNPTVANHVLLQEQLFSSRRFSIENDINAINENVAGLRIQVKALEDSMHNKKQQQQLLTEQLEGVRNLAKDGYVPRNRLLELERSNAQLNSGVIEDVGNIGRIKRQIAEYTMRSEQRKQEYQRDVRTQLAEIQKEADALQNRVKATDYELASSEVKAPVSGTVVELNVFTSGAVINHGFKLMEIVPTGETLIVEGQLPVHLVDKVHKDLPVDFIFSAFNTNTTPHIPGVVTHVSADRSTDERTGMPYYKVKAAVTPDGLKALGKLQVRPGMPVELFVKTGERTMMNYLMKPIFDRAKTSMKEE
jgi:protease secretion system membrane fusion protein